MIHKCNIVAIKEPDEDEYSSDSEIARILAANKIENKLDYELRPACIPFDSISHWFEASIDDKVFTALSFNVGMVTIIDTPIEELAVEYQLHYAQ